MTIWNMEITAAESPQTVHIPLEGKYYAIKNTGEHDILVSSYVVNPTEGADDVMMIPSGSSAIIPVKDGDLYVSAEEDGAYSISIQDDKVIPWSGSTGSGGDGGGDTTHYKGTTTTPLENGSTTNPIVIDGESYTAVFGDVVVYGYTEFVFDGTTWSEFGRPFDTVPTAGSTNAVTSDGVYKCTPLVQDSVTATGYKRRGANGTARGANSWSLGTGTVAPNANQTAIGTYNGATMSDSLFVVGNGTANDSAHRSNILDVSKTSMNVNGDIQQNGVPIRAETMPTITASMLGKVVQYVGVSDSNYKQGWNYVAVSDGAETPTYSWQALMDTTPTSGSTNAVTSDGVYNALIIKKGTGIGSGVGGVNSSASGYNGFSFGHYASASGETSAAFGFRTTANRQYMMALGRYNLGKVGSIFEIGNGNFATGQRSNILEVSATNMNVNGDIQINNVSVPTPYTTMPTITADMLGKIAMYVGATDANYTQGCFYVAATDGAAEPTYSWVKIGDGGGYSETVLWEYTGSKPTTMVLSQPVTDFDMIITYGADNGNEYAFQPTVHLVSEIQKGLLFGVGIANSDARQWYDYVNATTFEINRFVNKPYLPIKVVGVKY